MARKIDLSELQNSVGQLLGGDADLTALLGARNGRIQGAASPKVELPYVSIGESDIGDTSVQGLAAKRVRFMCHVWTNERGFTQNKQIEAAIVAALDDTVWNVPNLRVVSCFHERSDFMRDPMEGVRHGVVEFDIEVEPRFETGINAPATGVGAALANLATTGGTVYINAPATATGGAGGGLGSTISIDSPATGLGSALANLSISGRIDINAPATATGAAEAWPMITVSIDAPANGVGAAGAGIEIAGVVSLNSPATAVGTAEANLGLTVPAFGAATASGLAEANLSVVVSASGAATGVGAAEANLSISGQVSINAPATATGAALAGVEKTVSINAPATGTGAAQASPSVSVSISAPATATGASQAGAEITVNAQGAATGTGASHANLSVTGAGGSNEAETDALIAQMTVAPDATREGLINDLIAGLKADGVWSKLDVFYMPAAHDEQAGLLNWVTPGTYTASLAAGSITIDSGFFGPNSGGTLKFLTGWTFGDRAQMAAASAHVGLFNLFFPTPGSNRIVASFGSTSFRRNSDGSPGIGLFRQFNSSNGTVWSPDDNRHIVDNELGGTGEGFVDGVQNSTSTFSLDTPADTDELIACRNFTMSCLHAGAGLTATEAGYFEARIRTYLTAIGAI